MGVSKFPALSSVVGGPQLNSLITLLESAWWRDVYPTHDLFTDQPKTRAEVTHGIQGSFFLALSFLAFSLVVSSCCGHPRFVSLFFKQVRCDFFSLLSFSCILLMGLWLRTNSCK